MSRLQTVQMRFELITYHRLRADLVNMSLPRWTVMHLFFMLMHDEVSINKLTDFRECLMSLTLCLCSGFLAVLLVLFFCQYFCQDFLWGFELLRTHYAYIVQGVVYTLDYLALYHPCHFSVSIYATFNPDHHMIITECLEVFALYYSFLARLTDDIIVSCQISNLFLIN